MIGADVGSCRTKLGGLSEELDRLSRNLADVCRKLEPIAKKHDAFVASSEFQHTPRTALRAARETQRLSRREVAIRAGMTERNLAALEGGSQRPWLPNAVALGRALAIPIEELWPETFAPALNDPANPAAEGYDIEGAMRQALDLGLAIARVGTLGLLCGDVVVTMEETGSRVALGDGETPQ
jgi:transcriptional regulator with XRE-family HTH domain